MADLGLHMWPRMAILSHMHARVIDVGALVRLRAQSGLTMAELARRSGVSYSLIKYVHSRERQFSDVTAHRIARVLDCTPEDFSTPKDDARQDAA